MMTPQKIIELLKLVPLEGEGGMVKSTYVSKDRINDGPCGTAIYYFLTDNAFSHMHKLSFDEVYHFYMGDPVELLILDKDGKGRIEILGTDLENGQKPQVVCEKECWQGSRLKEGGSFALMGTTMAPGYMQEIFTLGEREQLIKEYPQFKETILKLTGELKYK